MKTLPPVSLDLRRATLEATAGENYVNIIVDDATGQSVIARVFSIAGSYDHAGIVVDRLNAYPATVKALRELAIVPTMKPGIRAVIHDGHRCRVCATTWDMGKPEQHQSWCALKGTET